MRLADVGRPEAVFIARRRRAEAEVLINALAARVGNSVRRLNLAHELVRPRDPGVDISVVWVTREPLQLWTELLDSIRDMLLPTGHPIDDAAFVDAVDAPQVVNRCLLDVAMFLRVTAGTLDDIGDDLFGADQMTESDLDEVEANTADAYSTSSFLLGHVEAGTWRELLEGHRAEPGPGADNVRELVSARWRAVLYAHPTFAVVDQGSFADAFTVVNRGSRYDFGQPMDEVRRAFDASAAVAAAAAAVPALTALLVGGLSYVTGQGCAAQLLPPVDLAAVAEMAGRTDSVRHCLEALMPVLPSLSNTFSAALEAVWGQWPTPPPAAIGVEHLRETASKMLRNGGNRHFTRRQQAVFIAWAASADCGGDLVCDPGVQRWKARSRADDRLDALPADDLVTRAERFKDFARFAGKNPFSRRWSTRLAAPPGDLSAAVARPDSECWNGKAGLWTASAAALRTGLLWAIVDELAALDYFVDPGDVEESTSGWWPAPRLTETMQKAVFRDGGDLRGDCQVVAGRSGAPVIVQAKWHRPIGSRWEFLDARRGDARAVSGGGEARAGDGYGVFDDEGLGVGTCLPMFGRRDRVTADGV